MPVGGGGGITIHCLSQPLLEALSKAGRRTQRRNKYCESRGTVETASREREMKERELDERMGGRKDWTGEAVRGAKEEKRHKAEFEYCCRADRSEREEATLELFLAKHS